MVKQQGGDNDLLDRLKTDPAFAGVDIDRAVSPELLVGRAPQQVDEFLAEVVQPILEGAGDANVETDELRV